MMELLVLGLQSVDLAYEGLCIDLLWLRALLSVLSKRFPDHGVLHAVASVVGRDFLLAPPLVGRDRLLSGELSVLIYT